MPRRSSRRRQPRFYRAANYSTSTATRRLQPAVDLVVRLGGRPARGGGLNDATARPRSRCRWITTRPTSSGPSSAGSAPRPSEVGVLRPARGARRPQDGSNPRRLRDRRRGEQRGGVPGAAPGRGLGRGAGPRLSPGDARATAAAASTGRRRERTGRTVRGPHPRAHGLPPLLLERGRPVAERRRDIDRFWSTGQLSTESNLHFGEGGAGTFSDGKLGTTIHDPRCRKVLDELVAAGASDDILFQAKPHLGSDRLPAIVTRIRETITALGGDVRFSSLVTGFRVTHEGITAVEVAGEDSVEASVVVVAPGNSARETFAMLWQLGVEMRAKPFAIGVACRAPPATHRRRTLRRRNGAPAPRGRRLQAVLPRAQRPLGVLVLHVSRRPRGGVGHRAERCVHQRDEPVGARPSQREQRPAGGGDARGLSIRPSAGGHRVPAAVGAAGLCAGGGDYGAPVQLVGDLLGGDPRTRSERCSRRTSRRGGWRTSPAACPGS